MNDHKLRVNSIFYFGPGRLWYVSCQCRWDAPAVNGWYGRRTWAEALEAGLEHQKAEQRLWARAGELVSYLGLRQHS